MFTHPQIQVQRVGQDVFSSPDYRAGRDSSRDGGITEESMKNRVQVKARNIRRRRFPYPRGSDLMTRVIHDTEIWSYVKRHGETRLLEKQYRKDKWCSDSEETVERMAYSLRMEPDAVRIWFYRRRGEDVIKQRPQAN